MDYIVQTHDAKAKRFKVLGKIAVENYQLADHLASVLSQVTSEKYELQAHVMVSVRVPSVGNVLVDPHCLDDAVTAFKEASKEWNTRK